jgi:ATP-binding cassette subfamily C (CFTR/MRP) protein 1
MYLYPLHARFEASGFRAASTCGTIAYASQQAWIRNASIKQNILFGLPFDAEAYERTVDACCLAQDFAELPFGEDTHIGEKGVNLSGGQKARIALARAVYTDADIYLLDDVLAALDSMVARRVFERCVLGLLGGKTRILITHSEDVVAHPKVDVLLLATDGRIVVEEKRQQLAVPSAVRACITSICSVPYDLPIAPRAQAHTSGTSQQEKDVEDGQEMLRAPPVPLERNCSYAGRSGVVTDGSLRAEGRDNQGSFGSDGAEMQEERAQGNVDSRVYLSYINAMGGWRVVIFLMCVQTVWQCL